MSKATQNMGDQARWLVLEQGLPVSEAIVKTLDAAAEDQSIPMEASLAVQLSRQLAGFGVLQQFLEDESIEEFWVNRPNEVFVHSNRLTKRLTLDLEASQLEVIVERMLRLAGRRVDRSVPFVDSKLPDGSRLHVVIPDITREHISLNVRRFRTLSSGLENLASEQQLKRIRVALSAKQTILISGATATGKTTLLGAILRDLPDSQRIISVEDTFELNLSKPDWVAMQTRPASLEGDGEVDLRRLVRESLRMRPDWLVVGEVRGIEAAELLVALNSGIPALCTIHANSASEALEKLATLPLLGAANVPVEYSRALLARAIGLIIHLEVTADGERRIKELRELQN